MSTDFPIAKDAYVAFDGLSIKEKIKERLRQTGIFTDQNYEGSNLSALNDVVSMIFSLLFFQVSKSSTNGQFSLTKLYEAINGIVKQLDYKPIGHQSAVLTFTLDSKTHDVGIYTIPRYSYISIGGISYSTNKDISFTKTLPNASETLLPYGQGGLLFQGKFIEMPIYTPNGVDGETIIIPNTNDGVIDNFNIHVFVKSDNSIWEEWNRVASSYLYNYSDKVFEVRFNENKKYEIKFGNNINGKKLESTDSVAVYYLKSDGAIGEVGANVLNGKTMNSFTTSRLTAILADIESASSYTTQMSRLSFSNPMPSSYYNAPETVDEIRQNAPLNFRSQFSLTTEKSYETFITTNFSNIIHDVKVVNNEKYLDTYIKYFYDLGLTSPQLENRALFNQISYADSCNFNNVYCFTVPKTIPNVLGYVVPEQKSLILNTLKEEKTLTAEVIIADPVYMAVDVAFSNQGAVSIDDIPNTFIRVEKEYNSRRNDSSLKQEVDYVIQEFFRRKNNELGQNINITQLNANILAINGVRNIFTENISTGTRLEGLQCILWNPFYANNIVSVNSNYALGDFQFPYINSTNLAPRITII